MLDFAKYEASRRRKLPLVPEREIGAGGSGHGYPKVYWLNFETLAIDWFGKIDENKCHAAQLEMRRMLAERTPRHFFADTSAATHYVTAVRHHAASILYDLRNVGVTEMTAYVSSAPIRVFASAVACVVGLEIKIFSSRDDAIRLIESRRWLR